MSTTAPALAMATKFEPAALDLCRSAGGGPVKHGASSSMRRDPVET
jgi:hypothetical protein